MHYSLWKEKGGGDYVGRTLCGFGANRLRKNRTL